MKTNRYRRNERGAVVSVWTIFIAAVAVLLLGIAVDLSGLVHAKGQAGDAAAQAARRAGQQISTGTLAANGRIEVQARLARTAAVDYLKAIGMTGTTTVENGTTLMVTATATYNPVFLGGLTGGPLQVSATATVRVVRSQNGTEH